MNPYWSRLLYSWLGVLIICGVLLTGCGGSNRQNQTHASSSPSTVAHTPTVPVTATSVSTQGSTTAPTPPPTPPPTQPTPPPTPPPAQPTQQPTPVPFSVTGINASANPSNFQGVCTDPMTITFTGTIMVPAGTAGGRVSYVWLLSNGNQSPTQTITFSPGVTQQTVVSSVQPGASLGNGTTWWAALQVTVPNSITSAHANFSFVCQFTVTNVDLSVSGCTPNDPNAGAGTTALTVTFSVSPGPAGGTIEAVQKVTNKYGTSTHAFTVTVPAGQKQPVYQDTVISKTGDQFSVQYSVTSPNGISSNVVNITIC